MSQTPVQHIPIGSNYYMTRAPITDNQPRCDCCHEIAYSRTSVNGFSPWLCAWCWIRFMEAKT